MDFQRYFLKLTLEAINNFIARGKTIVDVKRVRKYYNISQSDKSKINFIWRSLELLEKIGFITKYLNKTPKIYKLPSKIIKIENVMGDTSGDTSITIINEKGIL